MIAAFIAHLGAALLPRLANDEAAQPDHALLSQALRGQVSAVRIVTRRLTPVIQARVLRVLRRLTPTHLRDADDVVQKVWVVLLKDDGRQLLAFDPTRGISLEAYAGMIAERETRNHVDHELARIRRPEHGMANLEAAEHLALDAPSPEHEAASRELVAGLEAHLRANLPPKGLLILRLSYSDNRPLDEVCQMLGCNPQVVYNWQHRIRELTREYLATEA